MRWRRGVREESGVSGRSVMRRRRMRRRRDQREKWQEFGEDCLSTRYVIGMMKSMDDVDCVSSHA
jgi:hypothetical protein